MDCGIKLENLERTHAEVKHAKSSLQGRRLGIEPATFLSGCEAAVLHHRVARDANSLGFAFAFFCNSSSCLFLCI